eukprot:CAMPEP_0119470462 /NCGR_PEP_ID=MMETSP1344-20130328/3356_1 /TAXON_ID=236787 /ORGANISM="Florenciella parvula, Strain CCMP2471" /LENGTH=35 /DNA_ID= /DNA_START= /DNA_END= /DNA_ORIENTATION=
MTASEFASELAPAFALAIEVAMARDGQVTTISLLA